MDPNQFNTRKDVVEVEEHEIPIENGENSKNTKIKRKRRSKNELDGRNFSCEICGKAYLSLPALTNHNKTKHHQHYPQFKRSRGRPRKNLILNNNTENEYLKFRSFFTSDPRSKQEGESFDFIESINSSFEDLFNNYKIKLFGKVNSKNEHNFYKILLRLHKGQNVISIVNQEGELKKSADDIFAEYVFESYNLTNRYYFIFLTKFVILFRECFNYFKTLPSSNEYSQEHGADSAPDLCNEFITEFMENNDNYGLDPNELIEIIQHFCFWLYENRHTTSRLTLLN